MSSGPSAVPTSERAPDPSLRRILCPIDFSPASPLAVAEAVKLARAVRGEITILFVLPYAFPSRDARPPVPEGVMSAVAEDVEPLTNHEDAERTAQGSLEGTAGPERTDTADNLKTE